MVIRVDRGVRWDGDQLRRRRLLRSWRRIHDEGREFAHLPIYKNLYKYRTRFIDVILLLPLSLYVTVVFHLCRRQLMPGELWMSW